MFTPLSRQQWNYETAAHLLNRAGFGGTPTEIEAVYRNGLDATVHDLVDVSDDFANVPPPAWARPRTIGKIVTQMRSKKISPKERRERKREFHAGGQQSCCCSALRMPPCETCTTVKSARQFFY